MHGECQLIPLPVDDQMEVGAEQAPGVELEAEALDCIVEEQREHCAIGVVEKDEDASRSARRDVEVTVGEVKARSARHSRRR
jgi:hypothetical protein